MFRRHLSKDSIKLGVRKYPNEATSPHSNLFERKYSFKVFAGASITFNLLHNAKSRRGFTANKDVNYWMFLMEHR